MRGRLVTARTPNSNVDDDAERENGERRTENGERRVFILRVVYLMVAKSRARARPVVVVFRRPLGVERRVDHLLQLGARLALASFLEQDLSQEKMTDGAVLIVLQRGAQMRFRLLVAAAEQAGNPEIPASERAIG